MKRILLFLLLLPELAPAQTSYFDRYSPNYFASSLQNDEIHIEFLISLRYPRLSRVKGARQHHEVFGTYTGMYDFFVFTRPSGPVLSRLQNVGLHNRWNFRNVGWGKWRLHFFELSINHESNGQIVRSLEQYNTLRTNSNRFVRDNADDYISLSTHYIGAEAAVKRGPLSVYLELRPLMYVAEDLPGFIRKDGFVTGGIWSARFFRLTGNLVYGGEQRKSVSVSLHRYSAEFAWQFFYWGHVPFSLYAGTDNSNEISTFHKLDPYVRFGIDLK